MCRIRVAGEFDCVVVLELQRLLESLTNLLEYLFTLLGCSSLSLLAGMRAADGSSPQANTIEASPNVDDNAHDFIVVFILEIFSNSRKHDV